MPDFDPSDSDHQRLSDLTDQIIDTTNNTLRKALFEQLKTEFARHDQRVEHSPFTGAQRADHAHIKGLIEAIDDTSLSSDVWIEKIGELRNALYMHRMGRTQA